MRTVPQRIAESAVRTETETFLIENNGADAGHFIVDITAGASGSDTLTVSIDSFDPASKKWYNLLTSTALAAVGTTILRIGMDFTGASNVTAKEFLARKIRVVATKNNDTEITYSIGANLLE